MLAKRPLFGLEVAAEASPCTFSDITVLKADVLVST